MTHITLLLAVVLSLTSCDSNKQLEDKSADPIKTEVKSVEASSIQSGKTSAVFASGCFWCVEAVFESVEGVSEAVSGYAGGLSSTANYSAVSDGRTKHAEAVEVFYDPTVISYGTLLEVFFGSQDPTTLNQQGGDRGTQYRSTIFYKNDSEKNAAELYIAKLTAEKMFDAPITTTLESLVKFYDAEAYHQDFEIRNPNQPYIRAVSVPRLNRFKAKYPQLLKKSAMAH